MGVNEALVLQAASANSQGMFRPYWNRRFVDSEDDAEIAFCSTSSIESPHLRLRMALDKTLVLQAAGAEVEVRSAF
jgi:hypothetical protein